LEAIIKMDIQEEGWGGVDWIDLAEDWDRRQPLLTSVMNLRGLQNAGNFFTS
jgi:hypothetical protein